MRKEWTQDEVRFLLANAGKLPKRDICKMLKRSSESVQQKLKELRRGGWSQVDARLRHYASTMEPCPRCGRLSATIDRTGLCRPCVLDDQLMTIERRVSEMWPLLPPEDRATYAKTEAQRGSAADPLPEPFRITRRMSPYRIAHLAEKHAREVEEVTIGNLERRVKAAQKRKERIEKKVSKPANLSHKHRSNDWREHK